MADISASDVTTTVLNRRRLADEKKMNQCRLVFGDGALTYPTGGIPIEIGDLGFSTVIESLKVVDEGGSAYSFKYDQSTKKLLVLPGENHTHDLHFNDADVVDGAGTRVNVGTDLLGANTGADILVSGVADTSGAGGIVTTGVLDGVAIAAQTIEVEAIGW